MDKVKYVYSTERKDTIRYRYPTHINDLVMNRSEAECTEVFLVVLNPGDAVNIHVHHDTEQIFYMIAGTGTLRIGEDASEKYPLKPGDLIRIPPHTYHSVLCDGPETVTYISIDCFTDGKPKGEPTWDSHVQNECKENGWDFNQIRQLK